MVVTSKRNSLKAHLPLTPTSLLQNLTFLTYNDQPPPEVSTSSTNGIAKGVLLFGANSGAWITHTIPGFGHFFQEKYVFPDDSRREAQTAMCMSLTAANWPKIGELNKFSGISEYTDYPGHSRV